MNDLDMLPDGPAALDSTRSLRTEIRAPDNLKAHSDLTYRTFDGIIANGIDVAQSLFTGSLIRNCTWTHVRFARSDLDGVRVERCKFEDCDFTTCDLRSSLFSGSRFTRTDFSGVFLDDCDFEACEFVDCSFQNASLTNSRFKQSGLSRCNLSPGTFLHNRLLECGIANMTLGDCTFLYVIMRHCTFDRVRINAESVGAVLGLTRAQLNDSQLVHLGKEQPIPPGEDLVPLILAQYRQRKWYMGELVMSLNFHFSSVLQALEVYFSASLDHFRKLGFVKGDEAQFLGDLMEELDSQRRLPLLATIRAVHWCNDVQTAIEGSGTDAEPRPALRILGSRLATLWSKQIDMLGDEVWPLEERQAQRKRLLFTVEFNNRPEIALTDVMNKIALVAFPSGASRSHLVRTAAGSYIEVVLTSLSSVLAFQVFLFLINGCIIQLTELKERVKILARTRPPKPYTEIAVAPSQRASPVLLPILKSLVQYTSGLAWLQGPALGGYEASNIQSMVIDEVRDKGVRRRKSPTSRGTHDT
jgi:uncharacterized protein YjbI with pentapeptide repeats